MYRVPIYSRLDCIYAGPHLDEDGKIDPRTWFGIPIAIDDDTGTITYLVFPYGGEDQEIVEISSDLLTGVVTDGPSNV